MTKTILILAIATAFIAGTLTTGTLVAAAPPSSNPGNPFDQILQIVQEIETVVSGGSTDPTGIINDPTFGLKEIKSEIQSIETKIDALDLSILQDIQTEVTNIEDKLDSGTSGLAAIRTAITNAVTTITGAISSAQTAIVGEIDDNEAKIDDIEAKLDSGTSGLAAIKGAIGTVDTEVGKIEAKLDDKDFGLEEIKAEIQDIKNTVDGLSAGATSAVINAQDRTITYHAILVGDDLDDPIPLTLLAENSYEGVVSVTAAPMPLDKDNGSLFCRAELTVRADTDNDGESDVDVVEADVNNETEVDIASLPSGVDQIFLETNGIGSSDACSVTVIILLKGTVT